MIEVRGEGSGKKKRERVEKLEDIGKDGGVVIVGRGKYVGEGFEYGGVDRVFLGVGM